MERQELRRVFEGALALVDAAGRAAKLHDKGHSVRAAQKYADAAAAVRALDGGEDCLVVARLQTLQMSSLLDVTTRAPEQDADAAMRSLKADILPAVMAVLERRRAAGTLAAAHNRPVEMIWEICMDINVRAMAQARIDAYGRELLRGGGVSAAPDPAAGRVSADVQSASAQPLGKIAYLWAAAFAVMRLSPLSRLALPLTAEEAHALLAFVLHAVEMVLEPRAENASALAAESMFLSNLRVQAEQHARFARTAVLHLGATAGRHMLVDSAAAVLQLQAAWRRVLDSGVLRARGIEEQIDEEVGVGVQEKRERDAAAAASAAVHGLHACALPECGAREVHAKQFRMCAACRGAVYCSREHQQLHWRAHKAACRAARAAAETEAEAEAEADEAQQQ
jgi:hypothetical protein